MPSRDPRLDAADEADRTADEVERRAAEEASALRHTAALLRSMAAREADAGLTTVGTDDTLPGMDVNTENVAVKQGAGRSTRKSKAQRRLYESGYTISSIAKKLGEGRPRVSSWFAALGEGNRPIPPRHAKTLLRLCGIQLTDWPRVADR